MAPFKFMQFANEPLIYFKLRCVGSPPLLIYSSVANRLLGNVVSKAVQPSKIPSKHSIAVNLLKIPSVILLFSDQQLLNAPSVVFKFLNIFVSFSSTPKNSAKSGVIL
jgi:hypothetical protein